MIGETLLRKRLQRWHGQPDAAHQFDYYRCHGCHRLVTWTAIKKGGCMCGMSNQLSPANLSWRERLLLPLFPWWGVVR